jgi:hypothetical protein
VDDTLIIQLAKARQYHQSVKDGMKMIVASATASPDYKALEGELQEAMKFEAETLTEIEKQARAEFDANKENKHPHKTITFQSKTDVTLLDEEGIREWAFTNNRGVFTVDDGLVIEEAKRGKLPQKFFTATPYEKFTISQNLATYLPPSHDGETR